MTALLRAARTGKVTPEDVLSALATAGDEARLALDAVRLLRLTAEDQQRISDAMWAARATLEALEIALELG